MKIFRNKFQTLRQTQLIRQEAKERGIDIKIASVGDLDKVGIHRLYPSVKELRDAIDLAVKSNMRTLYIHNEKTWIH